MASREALLKLDAEEELFAAIQTVSAGRRRDREGRLPRSAMAALSTLRARSSILLHRRARQRRGRGDPPTAWRCCVIREAGTVADFSKIAG